MDDGKQRALQLLDEPEDPFARICDVELEHQAGCGFTATLIDRDGKEVLEAPMPVGPEHGLEAVTMFTLSSAYCMASSLNYYLAKMRVLPRHLAARGHVEMRLTEEMFRRIDRLHIDIRISVEEGEMKRLLRALEQFTDLCIITESVKGSFPISVKVHHPWGVHVAMSE